MRKSACVSLYLLLSLWAFIATTCPDSNIYSYVSTISFPGNQELDRSIKGHVLVHSRHLKAHRKPSGSLGASHRQLLQLIIDLEGFGNPFHGLVVRGELGYVEAVLVPSTNRSDPRHNFFKAVASIFSFHHTFAPGIEYDVSGKCRTFYAEVDDSDTSHDSNLVIDKEKVACEPIGEPIDAGLWSISPVLSDNRVTHSWVRYHIERGTGVLLKANTHEEHKIAFSLDSDYSEKSRIEINGVQKLEKLSKSSTEGEMSWQKLGGLLKSSKSNDLSAMAREILGGSYRAEHLALSVPPQSTSAGCGIQSAVFDEVSLSSSDVNLNLQSLRDRLKEFERVIEEPASIASAHAALQLIRFLRCLPSDPIAVQTAASALEFIPSSYRDLNRQIETRWHKLLTDIVIDCGTDLCLELLRQRITKITELAAFEKKGTGVPREVHPVRIYLLDTLWPAIGHITNPSIKTLRELAGLCFYSLPIIEKNDQIEEDMELINPYNCIVAVVSLVTKFRGKYAEERQITSKVEDTLRNFIKEGIHEYEDTKFHRQKLLAAFASAGKMKLPSLSDSIIMAIENARIPSVIRFAGFNALKSLNYTDKTATTAYVISKLRDFLDAPSSSSLFSEAQDELILKYGAFSVLLNLELPAPELARIIAKFGSRRQWSLLTSCRRLIDSWCSQELLSESSCHCLRYGGPFYSSVEHPEVSCSLGLAAGWSGLAGTNVVGEVDLIRGDLLDNRPFFLSDYSLQWITGPQGEIRTSHLDVSLIDLESEVKLMSFDIYADQVAALLGNFDSKKNPWFSFGFSLLRGTLLPKQIFSGGLTDIMSLLFSLPDQPTPFLITTRLPLDLRRYIASSAGWLVKNDILGVSSIELYGALSSSFLSQSVTALIRTRGVLAIENLITLVTPNGSTASKSVRVAVNGAGFASRFDFRVHTEISGLPETVCMHFQRSKMTHVQRWIGGFSDSLVLGNRREVLRRLPKSSDGKNDHYRITHLLSIPPVSFHLGSLNSRRCRLIGIGTEWN